MLTSFTLIPFILPLAFDDFEIKEVDVSDLKRFNVQQWECKENRRLLFKWRDYLLFLQKVHGTQRCLNKHLNETQWLINYWTILHDAQETWLVGPLQQERVLLRLKQHIGPHRYYRGWTPTPILPETIIPDVNDLYPPIPPSGKNGAAGVN